MSVLGHSRRFRDVRAMSGLPSNSRHFRTQSALRICAKTGSDKPYSITSSQTVEPGCFWSFGQPGLPQSFF
jgi:hypothetical protein